MPITLGHLWPGVYSRHGDTPVAQELKHKELFTKLEEFTGGAFNKDSWEVVKEYLPSEGDKYQCICSHNELYYNYIIQHRPTGTRFSIGSTCIKKFGNKSLDKMVNSLKRDNRCHFGNLIADKRSKRGRLDQCDEPGCRCRDKCPWCKQAEWACVCYTCSNCSARVPMCRCPRCNTCRKISKHCSCKKCQCGKIILESWKTKCIQCYYATEKVKCVDCETLVPKNKFRPRCVSCWKKLKEP